MRKLLFFTIILFSIISLLLGQTDTITRNNTHMRQGPGCFYPVIMVLNKGAEIDILDKDELWLQIECIDTNGWISNNALAGPEQETDFFNEEFTDKDNQYISQASVSAAVRGFAQKYLSGVDGDASFLDRYDDRIIDPQNYKKFKDETYRNRNPRRIRRRFRKWNSFKAREDFHITDYLEKTGLAVSARIARQGLIEDSQLITYINNLGTLITEHSELYYYPVKFYITKDNKPAAYATPIGMIFITKGLLDLVENEAELAGLLGHELSHVVHKHGYKEIKKRRPRIVAQKAFSDLDEEIPGTDSTAIELSLLANKMYEAATAKRQLKYEYQADKCGAVYAYRAGYDPEALVELLQRIKEKDETNFENFESNWEAYYIRDRIDRLKNFIEKELDRNKELNVRNKYRFTKYIK